jgi:hypothetical protein
VTLGGGGGRNVPPAARRVAFFAGGFTPVARLGARWMSAGGLTVAGWPDPGQRFPSCPLWVDSFPDPTTFTCR